MGKAQGYFLMLLEYLVDFEQMGESSPLQRVSFKNSACAKRFADEIAAAEMRASARITARLWTPRDLTCPEPRIFPLDR